MSKSKESLNSLNGMFTFSAKSPLFPPKKGDAPINPGISNGIQSTPDGGNSVTFPR